VEKYGRAGQATEGDMIRRMRIAYWITTVTNTHPEYVIPTASPLLKWLYERATMLRYTFTVRLVINPVNISAIIIIIIIIIISS
jgi:hypothetical protein